MLPLLADRLPNTGWTAISTPLSEIESVETGSLTRNPSFQNHISPGEYTEMSMGTGCVHFDVIPCIYCSYGINILQPSRIRKDMPKHLDGQMSPTEASYISRVPAEMISAHTACLASNLIMNDSC